MARLLTWGYDLQHAQLGGYTLGGTMTFETGSPLSGSGSAIFAGGNYNNFMYSGGTSLRAYYCRARVKINSLPSARQHLLSHITAATDAFGIVAIDSSGAIVLAANDATFNDPSLATTITVTAGQTILVEIKTIIDTGGTDTLEFKINNTSYGPFTGAYGTVVLGGITVGPWLGNGGNFTIDDVAINDDQGASENTWCGDRKIITLRPISDPGTSHANWVKPSATTTNKHTALDAVVPVFEAIDTTSASAEDYCTNSPSSANSDLDIEVTDYATAGIAAIDTIKVVQAFVLTGSNSTTDTAGDIALANPTIAALSFAEYGLQVASSTTTTWVRRSSTISYAPTPTRATKPTVTVRKVTATTRVVAVQCMAVMVEYEVGVAVARRPYQSRRVTTLPPIPPTAQYF